MTWKVEARAQLSRKIKEKRGSGVEGGAVAFKTTGFTRETEL